MIEGHHEKPPVTRDERISLAPAVHQLKRGKSSPMGFTPFSPDRTFPT
jgi:hypothetical protein